MDLLKEPNGSTQLNIILRRGSKGSSVKIIRSIRSINATGRRLCVDSGNGIQQNLECLALHNARGREKLLLIRHLAAMAQL